MSNGCVAQCKTTAGCFGANAFTYLNADLEEEHFCVLRKTNLAVGEDPYVVDDTAVLGAGVYFKSVDSFTMC